MNEDQRKKFRTKILDIKRIVSEIKKLGIDITQLEKTINSIEKETEQKANEVYEKYDELETEAFFIDYLNDVYNSSIKKVELIYDELLEEYNTYYQIHSQCNLLNEKLTTEAYTNMGEYINIIKTLLKVFQNTSIANSDMEKKLAEIMYQLVYHVIQLELNDKEVSSLLEYIKRSEINSSYLETYIQQEVSSINLTDSNNKEINQRIQELRAEGLNFSYLDSKLIKLLSSSEEENIPTEQSNISNEVTSSLDLIPQYYEMLLELFEEQKCLERKEQTLNDEISKQMNKKHRKVMSVIKRNLLLTTYVSSLIVSFYAAKQDSTSKKFFTTTESYNLTTNTNIPTTTDYQEEAEIPISIITYNPWKEASWWEREIIGEYDFARKVETYDVSDINYENLSDYATISTLELGIKPFEEIERKDSLVPDDLYEETFKIVQRITQDKSMIKKELNEDKFGMSITMLLVFIGTFHFLISLANKEEIILGLIRSSYKDYKKSRKLKKEIKEYKEELIDYKERLKIILDQIEKLRALLENEYKNLSTSDKEKESIKAIIRKVRTRK